MRTKKQPTVLVNTARKGYILGAHTWTYTHYRNHYAAHRVNEHTRKGYILGAHRHTPVTKTKESYTSASKIFEHFTYDPESNPIKEFKGWEGVHVFRSEQFNGFADKNMENSRFRTSLTHALALSLVKQPNRGRCIA